MKPKNPNCFDCHHFFVTWDQNFPRGCRAYGIKTPQIPSLEVQQADGRPCMLFTPKKKTNKK